MLPALESPSSDLNDAAGVCSGETAGTTGSSSPSLNSGEEEDENPYLMHLTFYTLSPALCGVPRTIYGGVITTICDTDYGRLGIIHRDPADKGYTMYTNTRFVKPIILDDNDQAIVVVESQLSHRRLPPEDRKRRRRMLVLASVEGPDGKVYATAESVLMETPWKERL